MTSLDSFDISRITVSSSHPRGGVELFVRIEGSGEGLLLLHGYPQTGRYVPFLSRSPSNPISIHLYQSALTGDSVISLIRKDDPGFSYDL